MNGTKKKLIGTGKIQVDGDLNGRIIDVVSMLNMAFAMSNIREEIGYKFMNDHERSLLHFVLGEFKRITGIDATVDRIRDFLLDFPDPGPVHIDKIREFNMLAKKTLQAA